MNLQVNPKTLSPGPRMHAPCHPIGLASLCNPSRAPPWGKGGGPLARFCRKTQGAPLRGAFRGAFKCSMGLL